MGKRISREAYEEKKVLRDSIKELNRSTQKMENSYGGGVKQRLEAQAKALSKTVRKIQRTGRGSREW